MNQITSEPACSQTDVLDKMSKPSEERLSVCVVTYLTSPYQVEFFNEIARQGRIQLRVIYLHQEKRPYSWVPVPRMHDHMMLENQYDVIRRAFAWSLEADLTVCNYYTHWFALAALYVRHWSDRPWTFWGETPGFLRLGWFGRWGRKVLLSPIANSEAPVWAIGRNSMKAYRRDWGSLKTYVNLPYFSDLARFLSQKRAFVAGERHILYCGILNHRKGVLELAQAFRSVAMDCPNLMLVVVGTGPLEGVMRKILEPVGQRVKWEGFRQWHELPSCYARADCLCLPTRHDGWAMVIPEALASGLPVLTTRDAGAAIELVEDGVNGWVMPETSVGCIANALRRIAAFSSDELHKLGERARESIKNHGLESGCARFFDAAREALVLFHCRLHSVAAQAPSKAPPLLLTGTYAPDRLNSMQRYIKVVKESMKDYPGKVCQIDPPVVFGKLKWIPIKPRKLLEYVDKYVFFPIFLRWRAARASSEGGCLIHVTDQGLGLVVPWISDFTIILTCHDLIAVRGALGEIPAMLRARWRGWFQRLNLEALKLCSTIVCVSRKTLADCERLIGARLDYHVIYNPLDPVFEQDTAQVEVPGLPERFLLHVGNSLWYKNRPGLLKIYAVLRQIDPDVPDLVMMGDFPTQPEIAIVADLGIKQHVIWISRPPGNWIMAAYDHAILLIFPSLEEGFGWPVLEAMSRGCPVVTSRRAPLSEIGADAVTYVEPEACEETARIILECLHKGEQWRQKQAASGRARARDFSLEKFGEEWMRVCQSVVRNHAL